MPPDNPRFCDGLDFLTIRALTRINDGHTEARKDSPALASPLAARMIHSPTHSPTQPRVERCPVCGVAMVSSRTKPSQLQPDHFECLSCGEPKNNEGT